jgi:hypothetical protein
VGGWSARIEGSNPDLNQQIVFLRETIKLLEIQVNSFQNKMSTVETMLAFQKNYKSSRSEAFQIPFKPISKNQQCNAPPINSTSQNGSNFIKLGSLSEEDKTQIINAGFSPNQTEKISIKNYYERVKRTELYRSLKESFEKSFKELN